MKWQREIEEREAQVEEAEDVVCERLRQVCRPSGHIQPE